MFNPEPSHVELDGSRYRVLPKSYKEWVESSYQSQPGIAGSSRPAENPRPEIRTWRIDDWSAGEGYKFYNSQGDDPSQRGYLGSSAINVHIPGQVTLGLDSTTSANAVSTGIAPSQGAYLGIAGGSLWLAGADKTYEQTALDTWTDRTNGFTAGVAVITGPIGGHTSGLFVADAAGGGVRRVTSSGNTAWDTATAARAVTIANGRAWWVNVTDPAVLEQTGLQTAAAGTTEVTFNGVNGSVTVNAVGIAANGSLVYVLLMADDDSPRLWVVENDVGREVAVFEGLFAGPIQKAYRGQQQRLCVVDGIVFVGGAEVAQDGTTVGRLDYFDGDIKGTVYTGERSKDASTGTLTEIVAVSPGRAHEVLLTTENDQWRYNLQTGGVSKFWDTGSANTRTSMMAYFSGRYYLSQGSAGTNMTVLRTSNSGSGTFVSSSTIEHAIWDFDLPDTEKILTEIEVQVSTMASGTSIELQFALDGGAAITTDSAGATMSLTAAEGVNRKKFTISDSDTERTFRYLQPIALLKTSNTANTPILYSITYRCIPVPNQVRFFEFDIDLSDQSAAERIPGSQNTGRLQLATLETLRDSTSNRLFTFTPLYKDSDPPYAGPGETQHTVMFAANTQNGIFESRDRGQGKMTVRLMKT